MDLKNKNINEFKCEGEKNLNNDKEYNTKLSSLLNCEGKYSEIIEPILQEELDERFEKSKEILERINLCEKILLRKTKESDILFCLHCQIFIDQKKQNKCSYCNEIFCDKHKLEIKHNCPKMPKDEKMQIYLNAKDIFKNRLKQIKMKACN
jgi:hypothetical protein